MLIEDQTMSILLLHWPEHSQSVVLPTWLVLHFHRLIFNASFDCESPMLVHWHDLIRLAKKKPPQERGFSVRLCGPTMRTKAFHSFLALLALLAGVSELGFENENALGEQGLNIRRRSFTKQESILWLAMMHTHMISIFR